MRLASYGWQASTNVSVRNPLCTMHPDLQHLIQLQDLDLAADRARRRIADMPAAQQALEARLAERHRRRRRRQGTHRRSQAARREIEKELAAVQGRLSKYKGQLMEVKTNKEYQAMQKEMATAEHEVRAHEDSSSSTWNTPRPLPPN